MHHIINHKWRWITCGMTIAALMASGLCLTSAFARQKKISRNAPVSAQSRSATSVAVGSVSFAAPLELIKSPISPIFFQHNAEPEIKVDLFGNIYVAAINGVPGGTDLWKSTDQGATFPYLGQPDGLQDKCSVLAQCLGLGGADDSIDVSSGGYLYVSSLYVGSVTFSTSTDGGTGGAQPGQAWTVNPLSTGVPVEDRQWVAAWGPQTVYMTVRQAPGTGRLLFMKSSDAGKTFSAPTLLTSADSTEGNLVVDPYNGNLYTTFIPTASPTNVNLLKSTDGGATWTTSTAYTGPAGTDPGHKFTILAVDRGGNVHLVFSRSNADGSYHVYLTSSTDQGQTWLAPVQVDNGTGNSTFGVMPWVVAGSPGIVDITWLGSPVSPNTFPSSWFVFFAQSNNALSTTPVFNQTQAVAKSVHDQDICFNGTGCASTPRQSPGNRDLLEYYTMALDPDGFANIAYPDSLTSDCPSNTCQTNVWFVKQSGGLSAFAPPAAPAASIFGANVTVGSPGAEPGIKVDSHNCMFVAAPGVPWVWKSANNGQSFFNPVNPVAGVTGVTGGDEDLLTLPQATGVRPDSVYEADLGITSIHVVKSIDGGMTWMQPGPAGTAGEADPSSDRQWFGVDRMGADQYVYLTDHEFASEAIRVAVSANDGPWVPTTAMTDPELTATTLPNTTPGSLFVNHRTHTVYTVFNASTPTTNAAAPPFGKLLNVWDTVGAAPPAAGAPAGPFTNHPIFKGVFDSPATPAPPAGTQTYGTNTSQIFISGDIDGGGTIYATWTMNNSRTNEFSVWCAASHDGGVNFYGPFRVSQGSGTAVLPWIAAGDAGRVDVVYYQSDAIANPNTMPPGAQWRVKFAQSLNADAREPMFTESEASNHIMHIGSISTGGTFGSSDRSLLDFFQVAIGPDGVGNIIFADNAANPATTNAVFTRQMTGPLALNNPTSPTCLVSSLIPLNAVSRKVHGSVGTFDVNLPLTGNPGIECRTGGPSGNHQVIVTFPGTVTVNGNPKASVTSGTGTVSNVTVNGSIVTIDLTGVVNAQNIVITLFGVSDGTNSSDVQVTMGVLEGDTTANGSVNSSDIAQTQSESGVSVSLSNFREDVTVNGAINSSDISMVQSRSGSALP